MPGRDPRNWMWAEACEMLEQAERMRREFFRPAPQGGRTAWQPPVDVFETERELWLVVALPGVPADRVQVRIEGGTVIVSGERPLPAALREAQVHRMEIPHGRFERRLELPAGRFRLGRNEVVDGCLVLNLTKVP
jgi:HSP20 family protein